MDLDVHGQTMLASRLFFWLRYKPDGRVTWEGQCYKHQVISLGLSAVQTMAR